MSLLFSNSQKQRVVKKSKEKWKYQKIVIIWNKKNKISIKGKRFAKKIDKINTALKTKEEKNIVKTGDSLKNNKKWQDTVDICKLIDKCSIEEISKYLIQKEKKSFPDIIR